MQVRTLQACLLYKSIIANLAVLSLVVVFSLICTRTCPKSQLSAQARITHTRITSFSDFMFSFKFVSQFCLGCFISDLWCQCQRCFVKIWHLKCVKVHKQRSLPFVKQGEGILFGARLVVMVSVGRRHRVAGELSREKARGRAGQKSKVIGSR